MQKGMQIDRMNKQKKKKEEHNDSMTRRDHHPRAWFPFALLSETPVLGSPSATAPPQSKGHQKMSG